LVRTPTDSGNEISGTYEGQVRRSGISEIPARGCFVFIGYQPNTAWLDGHVERNERGEILTDEQLATSAAGVFAAGDSRAKRFRQITTSVGDGTVAALGVIEALRNRQQAAA